MNGHRRIDPDRVTGGDFNAQLLSLERQSKLKVNHGTSAKILPQIKEPIRQKTFLPSKVHKICILLSSCKNVSVTEHAFSHNEGFKKHKRISDHSTRKPIKQSKSNSTNINTWRLNYTLVLEAIEEFEEEV